MSRNQLMEEARSAARNAKHNLHWMSKYPDRYDQSKRDEMEGYLNQMIRFGKAEMKNDRRPGQSLKVHLLKIVVFIIPRKIFVIKQSEADAS